MKKILICSIRITFVFMLTVFVGMSHADDNALQGAEGLKQMLIKHKGDVIYLDFWASWCGPCRKSFPWMNDMQNKYTEQGFTVISVNLDAEFKLAQKFLKENPASFTVVYDPKGKTAREYKVKGMPTSYLIGRDGNIKQAHTGFFTAKIPLYEAEIKQLIMND